MDQLQPGQMLGVYRIINQIGQGGMATVYKAYQPSMDRNVAIKVLPSQLADSKEFSQRFQQEAHIIARLEHPHILPVFDYGVSDGISFFVMRFLEAGTLKDKLQTGGPLPLSEIDRLFTQLADALGYAHSMGVIHRDLKPANALIDSRGNLFLTDFGIAKILESTSPRLTQTDAIMGTPAYISPEQAQSQKVDQRSDIYSLGIILYEMVTGRVPYTADTPLAVILKHISDPLPIPSSLKPDIPEAIEQVILKALAKNPADRFDTVAEFAAAWKRALDGKDAAPSRWTGPTAVPSDVAQTRVQPLSTSTTSARSDNTARWFIGCSMGACLFFAIAGVAYLGFNWKNFLPASPGAAVSATSAPVQEGSAPSTTNSSGNNNEQQFEIKIGDSIANGKPGAGAGMIEVPGSKDMYTFTANPGQVIYVHIIEPPRSNDSFQITMHDDLNSTIFSSCLQCGDPGLITLDRGGTYTIVVGNDDPDGAGTGAYQIKVWDVPPPDQFTVNLDDEISKDKPEKGAGYIENPGSSDIYTFTADSGQAVYFQVKEPPQSNDTISWRLEDETRAELFNTCLQCGDPGLIVLEHGGPYTITVGNKNGAGTGTYKVKLWTVAPPDEFSIQIGDTVARNKPGSGAGLIETPGAHDIYKFTGTAGQILTLTLADMDLPGLTWRLEGPDGNELFSQCIQCGNPQPITLQQDGEYKIIVGDDTNAGTGAYGFQITAR